MDRTSRSCQHFGGGRGARALVALWVVGLSAVYATARAQSPAADPPDGVEVLTRGPVHEAYAVPVVNDPKPGLVVARTPPDPVEEMPPDQKPAGDGVQWIPGYWSWDQAREDFVWVSGIWREPPPGRQWVPGYWNPIANGAQWVPGAWVPVAAAPVDANAEPAQGQAAYLPEPPVSLEAGPNIPRPTGEVFWSPGCWYWTQARYVWRPGFWAAVRPTWVWVPAHYVWTPGGCLFVEGYWDLPLVDRGILFAPVYYARPVYLQPAYVYTPTITIASPGLVANLFVQPTYNHYCFGDYYDSRFLSVGVFPWFSFTYQSGPRPPAYYDPLFTFYASVNVRSNPGWAARCREDYILRRDNIAMRPPRTYIEQTRIVQNNVNITNNVTIINNNGGRGGRPGPGPAAMIGRPIEQVAMRQAGQGPARMERIDVDARRQLQARSRALTDFRVQRAGRELEAAPRLGPARPAQAQAQPQLKARPRPFAMPSSPIAAARPERPQAPRPDPASRPMRAATSPAGPGPDRPAPPRRMADRQAAPTPSPRPTPNRPPIGEARPTPPARPDLPAGRMAGPTAQPRPGLAPRPLPERPAAQPPIARRPGPAGPNPNLAQRPNGPATVPLANRPAAVAPAASRPLAPGPMRNGAMASPRPGMMRPEMTRRPPQGPRPDGPAARAAARREAMEAARPRPGS